jgi:glycerol-3-phosphate dehydrogenase
VEQVLRDESGRVRGVLAYDRLGGRRHEIEGRVVFNATGAWSPRFAGRSGMTVKMRPGKGVHLVLDRKLSNYGVITEAVDGREIFIMPLESASVIGTTDDDFYGDPGDLPVTHDEVAYLLQGVEHMVPSVRAARVVRAYAGVRPTMHAYGRSESALSRDHVIVDHAEEGAPGMLSMVGGKLAAYRMMSEEAVDAIEGRLGRPATACRTHVEHLPGGDDVPDPLPLAAEHRTPPWETERLVHRQGSRAKAALALTRDEPALRAPVCQCEGVLGAELVWCARQEHVRRLSDLSRRCRVGLGPCAGTRCARPAAALFARERGLDADAAVEELRRFLQELWRWRRPALDGDQIVQEELARGVWLSAGDLDGPGPEVA